MTSALPNPQAEAICLSPPSVRSSLWRAASTRACKMYWEGVLPNSRVNTRSKLRTLMAARSARTCTGNFFRKFSMIQTCSSCMAFISEAWAHSETLSCFCPPERRRKRTSSREIFQAMNKAIEFHAMRPAVDRVFGFSELREALNCLSEGRHFGKVCLRA